jgi:hypothetical protein
MIRAGGTSSEHREVGPVEQEPAFLPQLSLEFVGHPGGGVDDRAAVMAHDVDVIVLGRAVGRRAVVEVGVPHQTELLEQLQGAVHGGQVDLGRGVRDLFGCGVTHRTHGAEHAFALRGDPQATGVQGLGQVRAGHRCVMVSAHDSNGR